MDVIYLRCVIKRSGLGGWRFISFFFLFSL